jgi:hypothetical protein
MLADLARSEATLALASVLSLERHDVVIVSPIFSVFSLFLLPGLTAEGTMVGHELRARL